MTSASRPQLVEQQTRADVGVVGLALDQRARGHDRRQRQLVRRDAVVKIAARLCENWPVGDIAEPRAGFPNNANEPRRHRAATSVPSADLTWTDGCQGCRGQRRLRGRPLGCASLAIEHIGARDLVVLAAHQRQLDLVLDLLDVKGAPSVAAPRQRGDDLLRQLLDNLVHAP